jgi:sugar phosphate permease
MKTAGRFYYGWIIVIGAFLAYACFGISRQLYTFVLPSMEAALNLTHGSMGNISSAYFIGLAITTFVWGILADRIGPRKCLLMAMVILFIGLAGMGFVSSLLGGCLFYIVCGVAAAGLNVPTVTLISHWFAGTRRGIAFGTAMAGTGLITLVLGLVVPIILANYSWQWSWWISALFALFAAAICWFLLVDTPVAKGLADVGVDKKEPSVSPGPNIKKDLKHNTTIRSILKRGTVWNLAGIFFTHGFGYVILITFGVAYMEELGLGVKAAAGAFALWGALGIPSPIIWGISADHLAKKYILMIVMALQVIGMIFFLAGTVASCYIGAAVAGFANIGIPTVIAASMADYYEPEIIGTTFGFVTLVFSIGAIIGPTIGGVMADATGTLGIAIWLGMGVMIAGFILALVLRKPPK